MPIVNQMTESLIVSCSECCPGALAFCQSWCPTSMAWHSGRRIRLFSRPPFPARHVVHPAQGFDAFSIPGCPVFIVVCTSLSLKRFGLIYSLEYRPIYCCAAGDAIFLKYLLFKRQVSPSYSLQRKSPSTPSAPMIFNTVSQLTLPAAFSHDVSLISYALNSALGSFRASRHAPFKPPSKIFYQVHGFDVLPREVSSQM